MGKKRYYVYVKTINVFGEVEEFEQPCKDEKDAERKQEYYRRLYRRDVFIQEFKVFCIVR